jgi:hypothetical protein
VGRPPRDQAAHPQVRRATAVAVAWIKYTTPGPANLVQVSRKLRPAPPPLEASDQLVIAVISAAWAIALVTLLVLRTHLPSGEGWWVWVCALGLCMGLFALWYVPRLKRARTRSAARRGQARGDVTSDAGEQAPLG